jgi:hypothetical protein
MPIEIIDLDEGRGNILIGSGIFTGKEYIDALKRHLEQDKEKFKKYNYSLTDLTAVTQVKELPTDDVQESAKLCKQAAQINSTAVVAIVADKDRLFGLSRMWEILMDQTDWDIKVFKSRDAAERWIKETVKDKFGIEDLTIK